MPTNKVNNNIVLKSGGGLINSTTDGLSVDSSQLFSLSGVAGEGLVAGDPVFLNGSYPLIIKTKENASAAGGRFDLTSSGYKVGQTFTATGEKLECLTIDIYNNSTNADGYLSSIQLYAVDVNGFPTGSALATGTPAVAYSSQFGLSNTNKIFVQFKYTTVIGTKYAVVCNVSNGSSSYFLGASYSSTDVITNGNAISYNGSAWGNISGDLVMSIYESNNETADSFLKSDGTNASYQRNFLSGFAINSATKGQTVNVSTTSIAKTGLTSGENYYVNGLGTLSTTPTTIFLKAGSALSSILLLIEKSLIKLFSTRVSRNFQFIPITSNSDTYGPVRLAGIVLLNHNGPFYIDLNTRTDSSSYPSAATLYRGNTLLGSLNSSATAETYGSVNITAARGDILTLYCSSGNAGHYASLYDCNSFK